MNESIRRHEEQGPGGGILDLRHVLSGFEADEAFVRARILYFGQVGYYALGIQETLRQRTAYIEQYFHGYTGRQLDPGVAATYRRQHLEDVADA